MNYPYGKAAGIILVLAGVTGGTHLFLSHQRQAERPDLVMAIFAPNHEADYRAALPEFEAKHGVKVQLQLVDSRALQSRLQSALLTGADVPDMVELLNGSIGFFTRGPLEDVGLVDLTDRLHAEGIYSRMVETRFSTWSSRGRIFALPHDIHPVGLAYRRDLIAQLGIDVTRLKTWDDFVAMGQSVVKDLDGDGNIDRYALDMPMSADTGLRILLLQRGGQLFDAAGNVAFDSEIVVKTIAWYVRQTVGENRIGYEAGWGQSLTQAMNDGLVLFYFCPDWRTKTFEMDLPNQNGNMGIIPLPAWEEGGCRTSTWGGTGLAITKSGKQQELAWELAKFLYLNTKDLANRFRSTNIVPAFKEAWDLPAFKEPNPFFGGQSIGQIMAELAAETPPSYLSPYIGLASARITQTYLESVAYYQRRGEAGLEENIRDSLASHAGFVRRVIARNVFLQPPATEGDVQ